MSAERESLHDTRPRRLDIPILTVFSLILLLIGQMLPVVTIDALGPSRSSYSVFTGILDLFRSNNIVIGLILLVFSVLFPLAKLAALLLLWFRRMKPAERWRNLGILKILGKWSMLDVFVVVVLVGSVRLGVLAEATVEPGTYVFATSILLSLVMTFLMASIARDTVARKEAHTVSGDSRSRRTEAALGLVTFCLFVAGLTVPIMHVEEWVFWEKDYSLLGGTWELFVEGELFLGCLVVVFVVLVPLVSFGSLALLTLFEASGESNRGGIDWLRQLSKWSMLDVFGLATAVVVVKIGGLADVSARLGLWLFLSAAALSVCLSWRLRRNETER